MKKLLLILFLCAMPLFAQKTYDGFEVLKFGLDSASLFKSLSQEDVAGCKSENGKAVFTGDNSVTYVNYTPTQGIYKIVIFVNTTEAATQPLSEMAGRMNTQFGAKAKSFKEGYKWDLKTSDGNDVEITLFRVRDGVEIAQVDITREKQTMAYLIKDLYNTVGDVFKNAEKEKLKKKSKKKK